jgi:hypothetical protein
LDKYTSGQLRRLAIKLSVFCGVSVDGFLARPDHALDFLDAGGQEPHGFEEFYGSVDVVVIGRKTFEVVLNFASWFYGKKPVFVLSSRLLDFSAVKGGVVEQISGEPAEIVKQLKCRGFKHAFDSLGEEVLLWLGRLGAEFLPDNVYTRCVCDAYSQKSLRLTAGCLDGVPKGVRD